MAIAAVRKAICLPYCAKDEINQNKHDDSYFSIQLECVAAMLYKKITISQCPHYESSPSRVTGLLGIRRNIHIFINVNTADGST